MSNIILTVSIAAYNAEKYLAKCLNSLLDTSVSEKLEVIVVNDGSTDQTGAIAERYRKEFPGNVKLINKENGGHGSTINTSIKIATGKYYKIIDSDDWVEREGLEKLVTFLEENNCDLVLNPYWEINAKTGEKSKQVSPCASNVPNGVIFKLDSQSGIMPYMHSLTYNTTIVKQMGSIIDENCFYVDMEYALFPLEFIKTVVALDFPVYDYLLGNATQSMAMDIMVKRRNQHLKVTRRLIEYYVNNARVLGEKRQEIFRERLKYAVYNQYKIYYHMGSAEGKKEMITFDQWLKQNPGEIYEGPSGRFMKIVKLDRATGWIFWQLNVLLIKRAGIIIRA